MAKPYANEAEEREARVGGAQRMLREWAEFTAKIEMPEGYTSVSGRARMERQSIDVDGTNLPCPQENDIVVEAKES